METTILHGAQALILGTALLLLPRRGTGHGLRRWPGFKDGWGAVWGGFGLLLGGHLAAAAPGWLSGPVLPWTVPFVGLGGGLIVLSVGLRRLGARTASLDEVNGFCDRLTAAYARLEQQWHRAHRVPQSAGDAIIATDAKGRIVFWNQAAGTMFGFRDTDILGQGVETLIPERQRSAHQEGLARLADSADFGIDEGVRELAARRRDGSEFPIEMSLSGWQDGGETGFVGVIRDISDRKDLEARRLRSQQSRVAISTLLQIALEPGSLSQQLEKALEVILSVPWLTIEAKGSIFLLDPRQEDVLVMVAQQGLSSHLLTACARIPFGYCLCGRAAQDQAPVFADGLDHRHDVTFDGIRDHGHFCVPILFQERLLGVINTYLAPGHVQDDEETEFLVAMANTLAGLIERKSAEERLEHLAYHDSLTGLPNRKLFQERLAQDLARARREGSLLAVMFMDLDRFKQVNDTLGHEAGDRLLHEVSDRLKGCLRKSDTVARLGGDEFTVALTVPSSRDGALRVADKIIESLARPFRIEGHDCQIGSSIGICFSTGDEDDPELLLQKADTAMYAVKRAGRNAFRVYDDSMELKN
ncbi:MAG: diguanylate cyclase [Magnetococcales bacterium]|nr:diguanylate cyclase [Magnetococcales bacterium]